MKSVTFAAGTLQQVYDNLTKMDRMLASSPGVIAVQTLAGALATGTHGQGRHRFAGGRSAAYPHGAGRWQRARVSARRRRFPAAMVSLGALGIVTAITLRTQPFRLFTCHKFAASADSLEQDLLTWNEQHELSKAGGLSMTT